MERISFELERQDVAEALRGAAETHGRSVEAELAALVERTYAPASAKAASPVDNWVDELIKIADGADLGIPETRNFARYAPDYPEGMTPLSGESFVDHITRISRPGIDLEQERSRTPHQGPSF